MPWQNPPQTSSLFDGYGELNKYAKSNHLHAAMEYVDKNMALPSNNTVAALKASEAYAW